MSNVMFENHQNKCRCCFQLLADKLFSLKAYQQLLETVIESQMSFDEQSSAFLCAKCVTILDEYWKFREKTKHLQNLYSEFLKKQKIKAEPSEDCHTIWFSSTPQQEVELDDITEDCNFMLEEIKEEIPGMMDCVVTLERLDYTQFDSSITPVQSQKIVSEIELILLIQFQ